MIRKNLLQLGALTIVLVSSSSFQNCANKQFNQLSAEGRAGKVSSETVFPTTTEGYGEIPGAGGAGVGTGGVPVGGGGGTDGGGNGVIPGGGGGSLFPDGSPAGGSYGAAIGSLPGMPPETFIGTNDPNITTTSGNSDGSRGPASTPSTGAVGGGVAPGAPIGNMPTPYTGNTMPIAFICSDFRSEANSNLAMATNIVVELTDNNGTPVCSFEDSNLRNTLVTTKKFDAALLDQKCPGLKPGKYALRFRDPAKAVPTGTIGGKKASNYLIDPRTTNLIVSFENRLGLVIEKRAEGSWSRADRNVAVITDRNPYTDEGDRLVNMQLLTKRSECDVHQSPLVIHLTSNVSKKEKLILSPQERGVLFDILGENSYPAANTPKRISWHSNPAYVFVVLPDANGQVNGIDQLFGNNTKGPDGRFALNGYEALAKYDGKTADGKSSVGAADGYINKFDPVYTKLRIWRDSNSDGVAQPGELHTLADAGIMVIDLHFDPSYYERDRYGNETKYKSVVQTRDGRLHLMFDLWYAYLER